MAGAASIGLDLGAGKCCVASVRAGAVTVLPSAHGDKTTPSFVAFTDSRSLVGSDARDQAALNATNTVYGVKTVIGRRFDTNQKREPFYSNYIGTKSETRTYSDEEELIVLPYLPEFSSTVDGSPVFEVEYRNEKVRLRPEEITALLIAKMKSDAEDHLGGQVTNAVITVPVNFGNAQRQATLDAASIAGLGNVRLINSTTAAAIAYWDHKPSEKDCIAVVDFGANSLNLSIVSMDNGALEVLEAFGGLTVGGNFIDMCMMQAVIKKFKDQHHQSFEASPKALMRMRTATEKMKHNLTLLTSSVIQVDSIYNDIDFTSTFTRREMEVACQNQLSSLKNTLHQLTQSKSWTKVQTVVLVGGSTRIPAVEKLITKTLGKPLDNSLNKDEALACGAALRAAEFSSSTTRKVKEILTQVYLVRGRFEIGQNF
ncbi:heat shock 70 kDa protein 2-like [Hyalella azteca]|uniref:Heat shock 70 kDa protein 2-like n=1 Tax=Hyalella azteca TaxID=294128 RepID=A0A979FR80_HYAAZ|nr:heat shock 70 kDa protein 2-like [Hyalella azteca]